MPSPLRSGCAALIAVSTAAFAAFAAFAASALALEPDASELGDVVYPDVSALCRGYVAFARAQDVAATQMFETLVPRPPRCVAERAPIPFAHTGPWKGLRAIQVDDGIATGRRLVVQTARGVSLSSIWWGVDDPRDPGCPSIVREIGIDEVSVQHGMLVVVMAGDRTTYVEPTTEADPGYRAELVRFGLWARDDGGAVKFAFEEPNTRPWLGRSGVGAGWGRCWGRRSCVRAWGDGGGERAVRERAARERAARPLCGRDGGYCAKPRGTLELRVDRRFASVRARRRATGRRWGARRRDEKAGRGEGVGW